MDFFNTFLTFINSNSYLITVIGLFLVGLVCWNKYLLSPAIKLSSMMVYLFALKYFLASLYVPNGVFPFIVFFIIAPIATYRLSKDIFLAFENKAISDFYNFVNRSSDLQTKSLITTLKCVSPDFSKWKNRRLVRKSILVSKSLC